MPVVDEDQDQLPPGAKIVQAPAIEELPPGAKVIESDEPTRRGAQEMIRAAGLKGTVPPVYRAWDVEDQINAIPRGIAENLVQGAQGVANLGEGIWNTVRHPYQSFVTGEKGIGKGLSDIGAAQDALRLKVADAWRRGDYPAAAQNALYYMIPMLGPQLSEQSEMASRGEWGRALGHAYGTAAQLLAPEALKGTQIPLSPRIQVRSQLNPVEAANQAWLESKGVETPLSMQTGSETARHLEGAVRRDIGGARYAEEARQATRAGVRSLAEQTQQQMYPVPVSPQEAGATVRGQLQSNLISELQNVSQRAYPAATTPEMAGNAVIGRIQSEITRFKQLADQAYGRVSRVVRDRRNVKQVPKQVQTPQGWDTVTDPQDNVVMEDMPLPVDMRPMKMALRPIAAEYARTMDPTRRNASLGLSTMYDIIKGPDFKPLTQAEKDLGLLKDAARSETGLANLRTESQGLAAHSVGQFQSDIDSTLASAYGGQQGLADLQAGRGHTAQQWGIYDTARETFGKRDLSQIEPVSIQQRLTWGRDAGIEGLKKIAAIAPDQMRQVGRAFIDSGGKWETLGNETKKVLFRNPKLIQDLDSYYAQKARLGPLTEMEPVKLFDRLTRDRDATIGELREVAQQAPAKMPRLGRAVFEEIVDRIFREGDIKHTQEALNTWDALGKEGKQIIYGNPALISDAENTILALKRLAAEPNPSGSGYIIALNNLKGKITSGLGLLAGGGAGAVAGVGGGTVGGAGVGLLTGAGLHVLSNAVLARMLYNPKFTSMLRQGIKFQLDGNKVGAAFAAAQLSKMAAKEGREQRPHLSTFGGK